MDLRSCDNCGTVIDATKRKFPTEDECRDENHDLDETKVIWHDRGFHPFVPCPVCSEPIIQEEVIV